MKTSPHSHSFHNKLSETQLLLAFLWPLWTTHTDTWCLEGSPHDSPQTESCSFFQALCLLPILPRRPHPLQPSLISFALEPAPPHGQPTRHRLAASLHHSSVRHLRGSCTVIMAESKYHETWSQETVSPRSSSFLLGALHLSEPQFLFSSGNSDPSSAYRNRMRPCLLKSFPSGVIQIQC